MLNIVKSRVPLLGKISQRFYCSSSFKCLTLQKDQDTGIGQIILHKEPVNSMNLEFIQEMNKAILNLADDKTCRGLIFSSSIPNIFSAGLDIKEFYKPNNDRLRTFWSSFQDLFINLYGSRLFTLSTINGHCPAGGCILSILCDYRLMSSNEKFKIGLNESLLSIPAPFWVRKQFLRIVGSRQGEMALQLGSMFNCVEAKRIGLIDELVEDKDLTTKSFKVAKSWLNIPDSGRVRTKNLLHDEQIQEVLEKKDYEIEQIIKLFSDSSVQKGLELYLESLKSKQKGN